MLITPILSIIMTYIIALLAIAFFTLLERKALGYFQIRKGPNKVGVAGLPQPFADALKLFTKEISSPTVANIYPFLLAPFMGLLLALILWILYPSSSPALFITYRILFFLCVSSLNVYSTLIAGWASNSKYALLGALRRAAQTISYEVRMALVLLAPLLILQSLGLQNIFTSQLTPILLVLPLIIFIWFITALAETNRTPFDFAEGESELVSGFNTEYSRGTFALIFMAEYINIIIISLLTACLFMCWGPAIFSKDIILTLRTLFVAFSFLWARGTLPRIRYDRLINLTWKTYLPFSLGLLTLLCPILIIIWLCAGMNG